MACTTTVGKSVPTGDLVGNSGTPVDNQVAVFTAANTIEGNANFTYDSGTGELAVTGLLSVDNLSIDGNNITATDTNGGIILKGNGTGNVQIGNFVFDGDQTVESAQDNYVFTYDHAAGTIGLEASASGGNVSNTGTPANNQLAVWTNSTTIEGTSALVFDDTTNDSFIVGDANTTATIGLNNTTVLTDNGLGTRTLSNITDLDTTTEDTINQFTVETDSTTAWTLALADNYNYMRASNASAITITVPPNSSVAFPIGSTILIEQTGAGAVTITNGSGVTLNAANSNLSTSAQYEVLQLVKVATDVWTVIGGTAT